MRKSFFALIMLLTVVVSACSTHKKKPKCNTCPKWDDQIEKPVE